MLSNGGHPAVMYVMSPKRAFPVWNPKVLETSLTNVACRDLILSNASDVCNVITCHFL